MRPEAGKKWRRFALPRSEQNAETKEAEETGFLEENYQIKNPKLFLPEFKIVSNVFLYRFDVKRTGDFNL